MSEPTLEQKKPLLDRYCRSCHLECLADSSTSTCCGASKFATRDGHSWNHDQSVAQAYDLGHIGSGGAWLYLPQARVFVVSLNALRTHDLWQESNLVESSSGRTDGFKYMNWGLESSRWSGPRHVTYPRPDGKPRPGIRAELVQKKVRLVSRLLTY